MKARTADAMVEPGRTLHRAATTTRQLTCWKTRKGDGNGDVYPQHKSQDSSCSTNEPTPQSQPSLNLASTHDALYEGRLPTTGFSKNDEFDGSRAERRHRVKSPCKYRTSNRLWDSGSNESRKIERVPTSRSDGSSIPLNRYLYDYNDPINARMQDRLRSDGVVLYLWVQLGSPMYSLVNTIITPIVQGVTSNPCSGFLFGIGTQFDAVP
ncbi:hypothetical protein QQX98_003965 [Neonectria punicea]|uniref:Uncharacterized protein n=1 Tax=Neonectria punicea TaxID=979145 RepID=A0ABR1HC84_9HYPO